MRQRSGSMRGPLYRFTFLLLLAFLAVGIADAQNLAFTPGIANLYAGDPTSKDQVSPVGYSGPVSGLVMNGPTNIAFDQNGNLYIMEQYSRVIRVVAAGSTPIPALPGVSVQAGNVYQVAFNGQSQNGTTPPCSTGDMYGNGCPATQAYSYGYPSGIAVDKNGNVYVAGGTEQIRVIYGAGAVPGVTNPTPGYIYAVTNQADTFLNNPSDDAPDGVAALTAVTNYPLSVTVDGYGNIFFTELSYPRVRVVYAGGSVPYLPSNAVPGDIYTVGSDGSCGTNCSSPGQSVSNFMFDGDNFAIAVDSSENLYVAGAETSQVWGVYAGGSMPGVSDATPGNVYVIAGTGSHGATYPVNGSVAASTAISLYAGSGIGQLALDAYGNLYVATGSGSVLKVDQSGLLYDVLGGTAACTTATDKLNDGCAANAVSDGTFDGVAVDPTGNVYAADFSYTNHSLIRKVTVGASLLNLFTTVGLANSTSVFITNSGSANLQLNSINFTGLFSQLTTGANDCNASASLAPGTSCQIALSSNAAVAGSTSGTIVVNSNALNATSQTNTVAINATASKATSTTAIVTSPTVPSVANIGQAVTFTATVTPQYQDTLQPTGTVAFMNGATQVATASLSNGVAAFSTTGLPAGSYAITAVYGGDPSFAGSTSATSIVNVSAAPAAQVALTASSSAVTFGQSVTLTANVTPYSGSGIPTGTVTFEDGGNPLPNGTVTLNAGTATFTANLPAGINELIAVYNGDSNFAANASTDVLVTVASAGQLQFLPGTISLLAGNYFNYSGQVTSGSAATSAIFNNPVGIASDNFGNTYVVDNQTNQVYVVASGKGPFPGMTSPTAGDIYTLGTGTGCTSTTSPCGDGGSISQASFRSPSSVSVDALNNLYVYDDGVIRKVSTGSGTINTIAGTWNVKGYSGDGGLAKSAQINVTGSFAVDANGNIYFADNTYLLVRRIDGQTGIITTVAGTTAGAGPNIDGGPQLNQCSATPCGDGGNATSAEFAQPIGVAVDLAGNIYVLDSGTYNNSGSNTAANVIRKVDAKTGSISSVAGSYAAGQCTTQGCGDGGPATAAEFQTLTGLAVDNAGDLYITDNYTAEVREVNAQTGIINTVVGTVAGDNSFGNDCSTPPCGDGGPATSALLFAPVVSALDAQGNLYVLDGGANYSGEDVVREVPAGVLSLAYGSQNLGTVTPQTVTIANMGAQPLSFTGLSIPAPNYEQQASGGTDCTEDTLLSSGSSCQLDIAFFPTVSGALPATATISSNSVNAASGQNTIALSGTGTGFGGSTPQTITFQPIAGGLSYGSQAVGLTATSDSGKTVEFEATGPAIVSGSSLTLTGAGQVTVTAYQFGDSQYMAATPVSQTITVAPATLTVAVATPTPPTVSITTGTALPALTYTITGFAGSDTQATTTTGAPTLSVVDASGNTYAVGAILPPGSYTIKVQQGTLALVGAQNYKFVFVNGTLDVTGTAVQNITFPPLSNTTYGAAPITLSASSSSGLSVAYTAQGPANPPVGNILTITGAGVIAVTASQAGNGTYAAASPVTQSFIVSKPVLNVAATSVSVAQGAPIPVLGYTITGFVNGETQAVVTGIPTLTTTATSTSPVGSYPITVAVGTLTASNYTFNPVSGGVVNIVAPQAQTITFAPIANVTYGVAPMALNAGSSSGLGVSYKVVAGHATLSGSILTITGAGTVAVEATQVGNSVYGPAASVVQQFTVIPAVLTVTANNVTRQDNTANPSFTYTVAGFVNGDTVGTAMSGTPTLSTTATISSPIGAYPINIATGNLNSANYMFNLMPGTLTITSGGPVSGYSMTISPQSITVEQGQIAQATITLSPVNFYQGLVSFKCGSMPANVTCTFSPANLAPDGTTTPLTTTLTINTNTASPVVGELQSMRPTSTATAALLWLPAGITGLVLLFSRKRLKKHANWLVLLLLLSGLAGLSACGGGTSSTSSSTVAAPGTSTFTVTAAGSTGGATNSTAGVTQTLSVSLKVQ